MATPAPLIDDISALQIRKLGVQEFEYVFVEQGDNFQQPQVTSTIINKKINGSETIFTVNWTNDSAYHGQFSALGVDTSEAQRGQTWSYEGTFDCKQILGIRTISQPTITQVYDNNPTNFFIVDNNPAENTFGFRVQGDPSTYIVITFRVMLIKVDISGVNSSDPP